MDTLGEKDRLEYERLSFFILKRLFCLFWGKPRYLEKIMQESQPNGILLS